MQIPPKISLVLGSCYIVYEYVWYLFICILEYSVKNISENNISPKFPNMFNDFDSFVLLDDDAIPMKMYVILSFPCMNINFVKKKRGGSQLKTIDL